MATKNRATETLVSRDDLQDVIDQGMSGGADFCEVFIEDDWQRELSLIDGQPSKVISGNSRGAGVRIIAAEQTVYLTSTDLSREGLMHCAAKAAKAIVQKSTPQRNPLEAVIEQQYHSFQHHLHQQDIGASFEILHLIDRRSRRLDARVTQVIPGLTTRQQHIQIGNSLGVHATDLRQYTRLNVSVVAEENGIKEVGTARAGALDSFDCTAHFQVENLAEKATRQALLNLGAGDAPAGEMPVVIDNGFGGVIFHEACGHGLETTSVAKKASVFCDRLGTRIGNDCLTVIDDGTIQNSWGSLNVDDEGMATQKTTLIEKGILKSYMVDYIGALKTGYACTGSGRRQSYRFAPTSRMRNTYIAAGVHDRDALFSAAGDGLYAKEMGGGSVNPATGEYNFTVTEAYRIRNGKIAEPVKGATLIGTGIETIGRITMIGSDLALQIGMCGSVSGMVPVTVGQPPLLVSTLLVGGRN